MRKKNKKGIEISLSPQAIANLEAKAQSTGYKSKSAYVEAWAMGELDIGVGEAIATIQTSLKELAKATGCQHPNPEFNGEFGFYQCPNCGEVWALAEDDPDNYETTETLPGMIKVVIQTDNPNFVAALISGDLDEVM